MFYKANRVFNFIELTEKIRPFLVLPEIETGKGCLPAALKLKSSNDNQGEILYVGDISKHIGIPGSLICHFYYILPGAKPEDLAKNQADNGYGQLPPLTVEEVRRISDPKISF